jgi:hypothetical protein
LTSRTSYKLRIEVKLVGNAIWDYVEYTSFRLASESQRYRLYISGYSGTNEMDPLHVYHNKRVFSTYDRLSYGTTCARVHGGGWWYLSCFSSCLNTIWRPELSGWNHWRGKLIEKSVMKIKG